MSDTYPRARVEELVTLLGAPWRPAPCPYGHDPERQYVTDGRGRGFWLAIERRALERTPPKPYRYQVTVRGRYPDIPGHFTDAGRPTIRFDLSRPLTTLARDMRRRFLPQFGAAYSRAVDELHARTSAAERRAALAESMMTRFPQRGWHGELRTGVHQVHVDLEPHPGAYVRMEIRKAAELVDVDLRNVDPRDLEVLWALFEQRRAERLAPVQLKKVNTLDTVSLS